MKKTLLLFFVVTITIVLNGQSFTKITAGDVVNTKSASRSANFIDINNDGWDDIFISNGPSSGQNNMLYLNNQDGTFIKVNDDPIVNDNAKSDGATFADADNDGDLDACVVTWYGQKNNFYRGLSNGVFEGVENIISNTGSYSETASWGDMDNDGLIDLYVTNSEGNKRNKLFHNLGDGNFEEINSGPPVNSNLPSRSVDWIDYDNDGDSDLFITNEGNQKNELFENIGNGEFVNKTGLAILDSNKNSAGSSWADIDNDGDFDLFVANYQGQENQLFFNNGDGTFTEVTEQSIVEDVGWAFGSSFADVDNDGDLDLFVCNAFGGIEKNSFYINNGDGSFDKNTTSAPAIQEGWTFGCAWGDYDNDGFMDLLLANCKDDNQENGLYRNEGNNNNWFKLSCEGSQTNRSAIGTVVRIKATINGQPVWQTRRITGQSGYNSQNSLVVHFGLNDAQVIDSLIIDWAGQESQYFENVDINSSCKIKEGGLINCGISSSNDISSETKKFKIFPNPISGDTFTFENPFHSNHNPVDIRIYNIEGKVVYSKKIKTIDNKHTINNLKIPNGLYKVLISQKGEVRIASLIIQ